jgi:exopolysaccharide biosynthesis protein
MKYFGAAYAINLDGGGSTTLVANDKVLSSPSDPTGQRRVSNAVLLIKEQYPH